MEVRIEMDKVRLVTLVEVLLDEISVLRDMLACAEEDVDRKDQLLAEKAEVIKMLGTKRKGRGKVTDVISAPKKRGPGRPKGSKNGKSK
jgi:hypothetical protein